VCGGEGQSYIRLCRDKNYKASNKRLLLNKDIILNNTFLKRAKLLNIDIYIKKGK